MKPIIFKDGCDTLAEALGITKDREDELAYRLNLIIHDFTRPKRKSDKDDDNYGSDKLIKLFVAVAETEEERIWCAYNAGNKVPEMYNTDEYEFDEWDEEED
jgi:hypothetical protein